MGTQIVKRNNGKYDVMSEGGVFYLDPFWGRLTWHVSPEDIENTGGLYDTEDEASRASDSAPLLPTDVSPPRETSEATIERPATAPAKPTEVWGVLTVWTNDLPSVSMHWTRNEAEVVLHAIQSRHPKLAHALVRLPLPQARS